MNSKIPETSIIIRTKNEERWLETVLKELYKQSYQNFEILIIDSGSTDKTLSIAKRFPVRILKIPASDFSYPYAFNFAAKHSKASKYLVSLPGHAIPVSNTWLDDGISNFKKYDKLCGVYGFIKPLSQSSLWDKFFINGYNLGLTIKGVYKTHLQTKRTKGILGFTNAIIRKKLWEIHHLDESWGAGGEDEEWADYWTKKGYKVLKDTKFSVYHSHNLDLIGWAGQLLDWQKMNKPRPFKSLSFRPTHL